MVDYFPDLIMVHVGDHNAGKRYDNGLMEFACVTQVVRGMIRADRLRGGLGRCLDAGRWAGRLESNE